MNYSAESTFEKRSMTCSTVSAEATLGTQYMRSVGDSWWFRWRGRLGLLFLSPIVMALFLSDPFINDGSIIGIFTHVVGWIFFLLYVTFRVWATLYVGGRKDSELQTEGPYSITRNPLYFGSFCLGLSIVFLLKSVTLMFALIIGFLVYMHYVIRAEERYLRGKFKSDFDRYCLQTPKFFPTFSSYQSRDKVIVNLEAMKTELRRLRVAAVVPLTIEFLMHFRSTQWWPHLFRLP